MRIGFGLPNSVLDTPDGVLLVNLGRRAEERGFASVAIIDRVAYPNHEGLITLAAVAGATRTIQLFTDVLLGPTREPVLLAKQAATLDQVSGGRFVLGAGVGGRPDDFSVVKLGFHDRGRRWDQALELIHAAWRGEPIQGTTRQVTVKPVNGTNVPMLFGGRADQAVARVVKYGIGYTQGGGTPDALKAMIERVDAAWREARRDGKPEYRALTYFAIGPETHARAERNVLDYYGEYGQRIWANAIKTAEDARAAARAYEEAGCDELIFFNEAPGLEQVDRLAEAVLS